MSRRKRGLTPEERELWGRVAASARPIRPVHATARETDPTQTPKPVHPKPQPPDFHIGQMARPMTAAHDLVPAIEERLAAQPVRIDRRKHQQLTRGKLRPEARIDLHGMTLAVAHPELIRFILNAHGTGKRLVLVITGKGKRGDDQGPIPERLGALRHQVPHWLHSPPLAGVVLQIVQAHVRHGGGGAYYVYLRRP